MEIEMNRFQQVGLKNGIFLFAGHKIEHRNRTNDFFKELI